MGAALQMIANNKQGLADQPVQTRRQGISRYADSNPYSPINFRELSDIA